MCSQKNLPDLSDIWLVMTGRHIYFNGPRSGSQRKAAEPNRNRGLIYFKATLALLIEDAS